MSLVNALCRVEALRWSQYTLLPIHYLNAARQRLLLSSVVCIIALMRNSKSRRLPLLVLATYLILRRCGSLREALTAVWRGARPEVKYKEYTCFLKVNALPFAAVEPCSPVGSPRRRSLQMACISEQSESDESLQRKPDAPEPFVL